jgi:hypothetical protein
MAKRWSLGAGSRGLRPTLQRVAWGHAEPSRMALTQAEVDEFMIAEKVVPASAVMEWEKPEPQRYLWGAPIEVSAQRVGDLRLFVNPNFERAFHFKLRLHGEDVYRLDVRPLRGGHDNPPGRPEGFSKRVPDPVHEHIWVEGLALLCARPIDGLETSDHRAIFEAFCVRTHVRFDPEYIAPQAFEQSQLDTEL